MELTYENMLDHLTKYFDAIWELKGPQDKPKMTEFFAPNFVIRYGRPMKVWNREQWVDSLCDPAADKEKYLITHNKHPYYWLIDVRKKAAAGFIKEQIKHPKTGQLLREFSLTPHFGFTVIDGSIKFSWELIAWVDVPYLVESLGTENPLKAWYDRLPK
jgi:hypothetical protein